MFQADHELIELAAKAAGYKVVRYVENSDNYYSNRASWGLELENFDSIWNPLENVEDAMLLAVKLRLVVDTDYNGKMAVGSPDRSCDDYAVDYDWRSDRIHDPLATLCKAIVRIAADIGANNFGSLT